MSGPNTACSAASSASASAACGSSRSSNRRSRDPLVNYPLLELQHACLALGFQGVHRTAPGGQAVAAADPAQPVRDAAARAAEGRPRSVAALAGAEARRPRVAVPRAGLGRSPRSRGALLFALFVTLLTLLSGGADARRRVRSRRCIRPTSIEIARRVIAPPPPPPPPPPPTAQLPRIKRELADDCITVTQTGERDRHPARATLALFESGKADGARRRSSRPRRASRSCSSRRRAASRWSATPTTTPIKTVRFPSNWHLSVERAKAVGDAAQDGARRSRTAFEVDGKGADVPIASNATPEGRAKNRRVEILIPRSRLSSRSKC